MRNKLILLLMLFGLVAPATAQVSIGIGLPKVSIGINLPSYPQLVQCQAIRLLRATSSVELLLL